MSASRWIWLVSLGLAACGVDDADDPLGVQTAAVIYDADDRRDVHEEQDEAVRRLARASVVAVIPSRRLTQSDDGAVRLRASTLRQTTGLCADERFAEQPAAAECSGVLIERDLVLTASHCFERMPCTSYSFVFGYLYDADGRLGAIGDRDVYRCAEVVATRKSASHEDAQVDFAVVRLDRPVDALRRPAVLRMGAMVAGEAVTTIGFPSGVPAKIDRGGMVRDARHESRDFFAVDADTFRYSSGSGVFDTEGRLAGVVVRGRADYAWSETCNRPVRERADGLQRWEDATYVERALEALCAGRAADMAPCEVRRAVAGTDDARGCATARGSGMGGGWMGCAAAACAVRWARRRRRSCDLPPTGEPLSKPDD